LPDPPLIAIVEDDAAMREAFSDLIEVFGFQVQAFDSSESFLAARKPGLFACLVTDLNLSGESGVQLRQRLTALEPGLPVIIISARDDPGARALALSCGAFAYLTKPINDWVLLQHLMLALGQRPSSA